MNPVSFKFCGLRTTDDIDHAIRLSAEYIGFIFFPASPRHLTLAQAAELSAYVHNRVKRVAVTVDMPDAELDAIVLKVKPDILQLHGSESPERVATVKSHYGLPVIKALPVRSPADIANARAYEAVADFLLFDAKGEKLPGGTGERFDWSLLSGQSFTKPWFLSGGLNAENVQEALRITGARMLDVSSGIESAPGVKDPARMQAFVQAVKSVAKP